MAETFIYKTVNDCDLRATLHPVVGEDRPLLVYLHGGGLFWGGPDDLLRSQVRLYNQAGYNVLSLAYRLAPETKIPDIIADVQDALTWVLETGIDLFNFDAERIAVIGSSAGAYLALMTGTFALKPRAIVSFYGYGDIMSAWYSDPSDHFNGLPLVTKAISDLLIKDTPPAEATIFTRYPIYLYARQQGKWLEYTTDYEELSDLEHLKAYSPLHLVDTTYPPTLLLHGDADEEVPYEESLKMHTVLTSQHVPVELITIPGGKHSFDKLMFRTEVKEAFEKVLAFLDETLL